MRFGEKCSYKDLAESIGNPTAIRAVASAVGCNPVTILIGCHRIISHDGGLGGFASGV